MSKTVTALFDKRVNAEFAAQRLVADGVGTADISLMMSDGTHGREWAATDSTKAAEGAATGALAGGTLGAVVGALAAVGTIATGGLGVVAAGPIVAALAGAGAAGAAGTLAGGLIGLGIPEHEAKLVDQHLEEGKVLLGVQAHSDKVDRVKDILETTGGMSVRA